MGYLEPRETDEIKEGNYQENQGSVVNLEIPYREDKDSN